ncbi:hypothetical protein PCE1_000903 [Barthelona sp. PCE]
MPNLKLFTLCFLVALVCATARSKITPENKCAGCRTIMQQFQEQLEETDPKKTITLGWRLGSNGKRQSRTVLYRKSSIRVNEILDGLCTNVENYGVSTQDDGTKIFKSLSGGGTISGGFQISSDATLALRSACSHVAHDNDEVLVDLVKNDEPYLFDAICVHVTGMCPTEALLHPNYMSDYLEDMLDEL